MKFLKNKGAVIIAIIFFFPSYIFAQPSIPATSPITKINNPLAGSGINTINDFIKVLLEGALKIGIPLIALAIIYSGFLFVKAQGNSEEISKAKNALLYTVIGAAVLLGSWAIAQLITETVLQIK